MGSHRCPSPVRSEEAGHLTKQNSTNFTSKLSPILSPIDTSIPMATVTGNQATNLEETPPSPSKSVLGTSAPGKVKSLIQRIERSRSNTLPVSPTYPIRVVKAGINKSEGGTPLFNGSPIVGNSPLLGAFSDWMNGEGDEEIKILQDEPATNHQASPIFDFPPLQRSSHLVNGDHPLSPPAPLSSPLSRKPMNPTVSLSAMIADGENTLKGKTQSQPSVAGYIEMKSPQRKKPDETASMSSGYILMKEAQSIVHQPPPSPIYITDDNISSSYDHLSEQEQNRDERCLLSVTPSQHSPNPEAVSNHSSHSSIEMLLDNDEFAGAVEWKTGEERTRTKSRRGFKTQIKKLFKRQKSGEVRSRKDSVSDVQISLTRKERSKSEVDPSKVKFGTLLEDEQTLKKRSMSDETTVLDNPPLPTHKSLDIPLPPSHKSLVKRSYTLLTKDITDKYRYAALEARRKASLREGVKPSESGLSDSDQVDGGKPESPDEPDLKQFDTTPPAEMSPQRYRRSLYCDQLKYKLRAALQNIHTPLSLSPIYTQLCADEDAKCDSRYQLILLVQHALQRSRWKHNDMEIALLTELLKMVEPLPNEL